MELLRISRDAYGREVLQGMSWDLLWVFVGAGVALIALHALYRALLAPKSPRSSK
jgi:formate dehydrogenase subunit gamma